MSASNPYRKNNLLKVVLLGDGGVGKSCLMNRFVSNNFDNHTFHTVGVEFFNKDIEVNGEGYTLQVIPIINCIFFSFSLPLIPKLNFSWIHSYCKLKT